MNYTVFNIGLNNNPHNYQDVVNIITSALSHSIVRIQSQLRNGVYHPDGETPVSEPTAVIKLTHHSDDWQDSFWVEAIAEEFCRAFTQECVPYRHVNFRKELPVVAEKLVYNPAFNGDRYAFDAAYFIDFNDNGYGS